MQVIRLVQATTTLTLGEMHREATVEETQAVVVVAEHTIPQVIKAEKVAVDL
jgi:hypothetical protein